MNICRIIGLALFAMHLLICNFCYANTLSSQCKAYTFIDNTFTQQTDKFNIFQKVYLKIDCTEVPQGSHTISTQWIDSEGGLQSERSHTFAVGVSRKLAAYFSLKHFPKGSLSQMISGSEYEEEQLGQWKVITFINNDQIGVNHFTVTD